MTDTAAPPEQTRTACAPALEVRGLARRYGDVDALAGVDLAVADGERFCLLGPSGSGKTTLLRLVAGFEEPDAGSVSLRGRRVDTLPPERRGIGVVFQDYALFPHRTVAQNIAFGLRMRKVPRAQREERVSEVLDLVRLRAQAQRRPDQLSGGQRQRVALARALAPEPGLLLLDEPLANLDRRLRDELREELARIHAAVGVTIVLVTHDQEEALSLADRVGVMRDGVLEQVGSPVQVWREPATRFVAGFLGEMNLLPARPAGAGRAQVTALAATLDVAGPRPDGEALACLRPEALRTRPSGGVRGTVERVAYAGGSVTYRVHLRSGERVLVREPLPDGAPAWVTGDELGVEVAEVACRLLTS
jgi:ABC-type Fe3+/spermidine/putrescine transport system ATPase subunit